MGRETNGRARIPTVSLPVFDKLLRELIAHSSISSPSPDWDQGNMAVIERLESWFSTLGFQTEIQMVDESAGKANLLATLGSGDHGLVLSGHTDTVPFDQTKWNTDPFKLTERDNKWYGLGTCDMKGFFPIIIEALRSLENAELTQPLIILATADEESSMSGARAIAESNCVRARAAVIGEPTSIQPVRMHKGILMESIRVTGQSGHSSNPDLGNSALEGMNEVMLELLEFRRKIQNQFQNKFFDIPTPTLNLGRIHGGDSPNRICGHCELSFDLRPLPGMDMKALRDQLDDMAKKIARQRSLNVELTSLIDGVDAFETPASAELVTICESLTEQEARAVAFATEAPFLSNMGMETIVLGAGSIDQAHQPDEYLALDQIKPMTNVLSQLITHYCINAA